MLWLKLQIHKGDEFLTTEEFDLGQETIKARYMYG